MLGRGNRHRVVIIAVSLVVAAMPATARAALAPADDDRLVEVIVKVRDGVAPSTVAAAAVPNGRSVASPVAPDTYVVTTRAADAEVAASRIERQHGVEYFVDIERGLKQAPDFVHQL